MLYHLGLMALPIQLSMVGNLDSFLLKTNLVDLIIFHQTSSLSNIGVGVIRWVPCIIYKFCQLTPS